MSVQLQGKCGMRLMSGKTTPKNGFCSSFNDIGWYCRARVPFATLVTVRLVRVQDAFTVIHAVMQWR
eukprot:543257-Amphidinium_carterae.1